MFLYMQGPSYTANIFELGKCGTAQAPAPSKTQTAEVPPAQSTEAPTTTTTAEITTPTEPACTKTFTDTEIKTGKELGTESCAYDRKDQQCVKITKDPKAPFCYLLTWKSDGSYGRRVSFDKELRGDEPFIGCYTDYGKVANQVNGYKFAKSENFTVTACAAAPTICSTPKTFIPTTTGTQLGAGGCAYNREGKCVKITKIAEDDPPCYLLAWTSTPDGTFVGYKGVATTNGFIPKDTEQIIGCYTLENYYLLLNKPNGYQLATSENFTVTACCTPKTFTPTVTGTQLGTGSCAYNREDKCIEISNVPPRHYLLSWTSEGAWAGPVPSIGGGKYKPKDNQQIIGAYDPQNYPNASGKPSGYQYATSGNFTVTASGSCN